MNATEALEQIVSGKPVRLPCCTACGVGPLTPPMDMPRNRPAGTRRWRRAPSRGIPFLVQGCAGCGHIMAESADGLAWRDLTRAEADIVQRSADWTYLRSVVDAAVGHLVG